MKRIVVDASFCGALILEDEASQEADMLLGDVLAPGGPCLVAPALWSYEMLNLLRSAVKRKRLTQKQAFRGLSSLNNLPIQLVTASDHETKHRVFEIALEQDLSAYDASYFELADRLNTDLFTNDKKLRSAFENR